MPETVEQLEELRQLDRRDSIACFSHPATPIRVRVLQLFGEAGGVNAEAARLAEVDLAVGELACLMEFEPTEPMVLQAGGNSSSPAAFWCATRIARGSASRGGMRGAGGHPRAVLPGSRGGDGADHVGGTEQAREMMRRSAVWLRAFTEPQP